MSIKPHKEFRIMFRKDFDTVKNARFRCEEDESCLYDLIKYIYYNTDDINIKANIEWAMRKCSNTEFLQEPNKSYFSEPYSDLLQRGSNC